MATTSSKTKKKALGGDATSSKKQRSKGQAADALMLRRMDDRRVEFRFAPRSNAIVAASVFLTGLGALLAGAGVFARWIRAAGPHEYATPLLVVGLLLVVFGWALGTRAVPTLRIGDAGLATERGDTIDRLAWFEVDAVRLAAGVLTFSGAGHVVAIPLSAHPDAAAYALREARSRIPSQVADITERLDGSAPDASTRIVLEPPQIAGLQCKESGRPISFEKDARLCGRCGQVYHRESVPARCLTCDARLS